MFAYVSTSESLSCYECDQLLMSVPRVYLNTPRGIAEWTHRHDFGGRCRVLVHLTHVIAHAR
eukprot:2824432-Rhodomonas_salina.2